MVKKVLDKGFLIIIIYMYHAFNSFINRRFDKWLSRRSVNSVARIFLLSENGKNFAVRNIKENIGRKYMQAGIISAKESRNLKNNWG